MTIVMAKRNKSREPVDRAAEYIDSPLMTQRLHYQNRLSVRIAGNYGAYRTQLQVGKNGNASCTCPSEMWPCKHVRALEATWKQNPESFFDLQEYLDKLQSKSKAELLALIGEICITSPEVLASLGVEGFEEDEEDDDDEFYG